MHKVIDLLSAQTTPRLRAGLWKAKRSSRGFVILDGTLIRCAPSRATQIARAIATLNAQERQSR